MKQEQLELLRNLFGNSGDIVWITDENWKIQWGRYDYSRIRNLPELLHLPETLWEDASSEVFFNGFFYDCTVHCSRENKCRIVIMKKSESFHGLLEEIPVNTAVHSLRQIRKSFEQYLEEKHLDEKKGLLDLIEKNCILLYRRPYITRITNSVRNGTASKLLFSVQEMLVQIQDNIHSELGIYAETDFSFPDKTVYLIENEEFFRVVVLAGLTLCHQEYGYIHQAVFSLGVSGTKAELIINLTPDYQHPVDMSKQLDPGNFGTFEEEKKALETFCTMHYGHWKLMNYTEEGRLISSCCQICFRTDEYHPEITVRSPRRVLRSDFDDVYRLMLSRIYLSEFSEI